MPDIRERSTVALGLRSGDPAGPADARGALAYHPEGSLRSLAWSRTDGTTVRSHSAIGYDLGGNRVSSDVAVVLPDGATRSGSAAFTYDLASRLRAWSSPYPHAGDGASASEVAYGLDDAGNITVERTMAGGALRESTELTYQHNRLMRSVTDRDAGGSDPDTRTTVDFVYSLLGEQEEKATTIDITEGGAWDQVPDQTVVETSGHDPAGHTDVVAADGQTEYAQAQDATVDHLYAASGDRLIAQTTDGQGAEPAAATLYFYAGSSGQLVEETDSDGTPRVRYLLDGSRQPLAQQRNPTDDDGEVTSTTEGVEWSWLLVDEHASTATRLRDDGRVLEQRAYDPYGRTDAGGSCNTADGCASDLGGETPGEPSTGQLVGAAEAFRPGSTLGFQSDMTSATTGNLLVGPRQYDPSVRRFTTADTYFAAGADTALGLDPLTGNRYLFAGANPVAFYDDGHRPTCGDDCGEAAGGTTGGDPDDGDTSDDYSGTDYENEKSHTSGQSASTETGPGATRDRATDEARSDNSRAGGVIAGAGVAIQRLRGAIGQAFEQAGTDIRVATRTTMFAERFSSTIRPLSRGLRFAGPAAAVGGGLLEFGLNLASGQGGVEAGTRAAGSTVGAGLGALGAAAGVARVCPAVACVGLAAVAGSLAGGYAGDYAASQLFEED